MSEQSGRESGRGVLVSGATGLVGGRLVPKLAHRHAFVRTLSRSASRSPGADRDAAGVEVRAWDGIDPGPEALDDVGAVVHLAGEPIFGGLPTKSRLERVRSSRIESTAKIVDRMLERPEEDRPEVFVCASAVGYYGDAGDRLLDERAPNGEGFLAGVCRDWEAEAARAKAGGVRVVSLRIGVVLARESGALALMKRPFSLGLGGRIGRGDQYFPWIHAEDLARAIVFVIDSDLEGPVNAVAPENVRNVDLTRALADVLGRPAILPVPAFVVKAALGPISGELLGSRRVVPARLQAAGFRFEEPTLRGALERELG